MTNTITITGRLAQDPELRFSAKGTPCCTVVVPDQKRRKDDSGQWVDDSAPTWFRGTVFNAEAEWLAENATKGATVTITGRLITREWTSREGEQRSSLEVDYAKVGVVSPPRQPDQPQAPQYDTWANSAAAPADSEIPF